jgi:hypothetical protein
LGIVLCFAAASTLGSALLSMVAVFSAYGSSSRSLWLELFSSGWIGGLVGSAYAAWFAAGSTFFDRGRGRWIPLVLDFFLGGGTGALAAVFPRSHAQGLLGDVSPLQFSQPQNCIALVVMFVVFSSLAIVRSRD